MRIKENIRQLIKAVLEQEEIYSVVCQVDSVNTDKLTCECTPLDGRAQISEVRLQADQEMTSGLQIIPEVGSNVLVSWLNKNVAFVSQFSDIKSVTLKVADEIIINGESHNGLVKVSELVDDLNAIKQDINSLKTAFSTWVPVTQDGGTALKTAAASWYSQQLQQSSVNNLQNNKVKHG